MIFARDMKKKSDGFYKKQTEALEDNNGNIIPERVFVYADVLYNSQGEESLNVLRIT